MKKVLKPLLIVILIIALVVAGYFAALQLTKKSALDTIDKMFTAIKTGDSAQIKEYLNSEELTSEETTDGEENTEMTKTMLKNLSYEVVSTDVKFNECTVKLNVSNKDLKTVFGNYMQQALTLAFSQAFGAMTEEEMTAQLNQYFADQYDSESIQTLTNELTLTMKKVDGKWSVTCDDTELINAVLPGYKDIMDAFNNMDTEE